MLRNRFQEAARFSLLVYTFLRFYPNMLKGSLFSTLLNLNKFFSPFVVERHLHKGPTTKLSHWKSYNDKIFPPQSPDEPRRPAYVCHVKESIKYSYKKLWYIACLVRGMTVDEALKQLQFVNRKGAVAVRETILEAQKMAVEDHNVEFKSNLWVSESFVGRAPHEKGLRRCARGRVSTIKHRYTHYFVTLEEGTPPKDYYYFRRKKSGEELLNEWLESMRQRKVKNSL